MKYSQKIKDCKNERKKIQSQMILFSDKMAKAMDLSREELVTADHENITLEINGFTIFAEGHPWNSWEPLLHVIPKGQSPRCGYSNVDANLPKSWHFRPKGTATEILPPIEIQNEIIHRIKQQDSGRS